MFRRNHALTSIVLVSTIVANHLLLVAPAFAAPNEAGIYPYRMAVQSTQTLPVNTQQILELVGDMQAPTSEEIST